jgi:hypothetical protein
VMGGREGFPLVDPGLFVGLSLSVGDSRSRSA